ncbi:putative endoribonuclease l-psp protein [Botrytis fragariae]|uniref:Putative endoribonuclease l-psp protein n=1 Tax=Botrytis fragariae TaxID=1964551 RepID=A0A8H6AR07_9HELO|nr:putative endoribonuclease l-psp protein [Botrytis fragariae]KAF5871765.1 putative endoribonuclease l-psp protein [Botrytis fragariae]
MSDLTPVYTKDAAFPAGPYSQAIKTSSTIYCSGQIPCTPEGEILTLETSSISAMTELCIKNLSAVLKEAGSSIEKVVKVNVFLTTMDNFAEMNGVYEKLFKHKPARSCVAVYQLPKGVPVEIECIALA